jgi:hypothetical protein
LWLPNLMASRRSWRRGSSSIGSTGRWGLCISVFLARDHRGWPCSSGSRMVVGQTHCLGKAASGRPQGGLPASHSYTTRGS